jgi:hypothetical protein
MGKRIGKMGDKLKALEHAPATEAKKKSESNANAVRAALISGGVMLLLSAVTFIALYFARL